MTRNITTPATIPAVGPAATRDTSTATPTIARPATASTARTIRSVQRTSTDIRCCRNSPRWIATGESTSTVASAASETVTR